MFGGGNFGSSTPTFGGGGFPSSTANTGVFGQPQQQPVVSASLFGGGFNQPKSTFGSFGTPQSTNTMFGQQNRLATPNTGSLFSGQTATISPFSTTGQTQQVTAGTSITFNPISGSDTMMKNGLASPISTRHQCITCMKEYETKSLEELRLEDYQLNRKGPQQGGMFGATQPQQQSTGLFSGLGSNTGIAPFGQPQSTFGAATSTQSSGLGLFSSFNQPKPATGSFFSSPAPAPATSSAFGTNTAFSFGNQPAQQTSVFGSNNNPIPTLGSTAGPFSFGQQPQTQSTSLFGQKQMTSAPTTGGFGGGGFGTSAFTNTSTANKTPTLGFSGFGTSTAPTFGTTATTNFGTGTTGNMFGGFQSPAQSKPFSFATPFSSQAAPAQPTFGAPNTTGFSFNTTTTSAPAMMGFGTTTNTFGAGLGSTLSSFSTPNFGTTQPTMGGFGFGLNTTSTPGGFSSFGAAPSTLYPQTLPQQQNTPPAGNFGFATTPYKDSPLFYNLIANRDFENMIKPTSPAAQRAIKEASRRRTSTSLSFAPSYMISKNATFPAASPTSYSKHMTIFDGFEDEDDRGFDIDILSPKTGIKKLTIKSFKQPAAPNHRHSISFSLSNNNFAENGFNDSEVSELHSTTRSGLDSRGAQSENSSPAKSTVAEEAVVPSPNERMAVIPSQLILNQKRRSGPDPPLLRDVFEDHKSGVVNTRAGYYVEPSLEKLDKLVDENGSCCVSGLVIGRQGHGEIRFIDVVNVAGVNIDDIVHFRHKEVVVYPDDTNKPPLGTGLNCPAVVCLHRVWPIDKATKDPIKYPPKLQSMGYEENLRRSCQRLNADFISYSPETGVWTFKVPHFSKYSCDVEEAEADGAESKAPPAVLPPPVPPHPPKGLSGVLVPQNQNQNASTVPPKISALQASRYESFSTNDERYQWAKHQGMDTEEDSLPLLRNRTRGQLTLEPPILHQITNEGFVPQAAFPVGGGGGGDVNVEHNPITPSDSNESDNSDWAARTPLSHGNNKDGQYESVLSPAIQMMKSALMEHGDGKGFEEHEVQPPSKKFRSPLARPKSTSARSIEINIPVVKQRKSFMDLKQRKHGPPVASLVTVPERKEKVEEVSTFGTNYVTAIDRRNEVPVCSRRKEDLFAKLSLHSTNGNRFKAMPRVTFGPFGTFVSVSNMGKTSKLHVNKMKSYNNQAKDPLQLAVVEEQLRHQMSWPIPRVEDQIEVLWKSKNRFQQTSKSGLLYQEIMMWELFQILWPLTEVGDVDYLQTRDDVANWLTKYSTQLFPKTLGKDANESILGRMKMGRREDACELAVKTRNPYLALLISQSALQKVTYANCEEQLEAWKEAEALDFISEDMKIIYRLCAGNTILDTIDLGTMTTSEWLQHFALYIWYCCPSHVPVHEAVLSFQQLLKSDLVGRMDWTDEKISHVAFPSACDTSIANLCVQLLKLYSFDGYPLRRVLDPDAYSMDCLDYKLSWLLMVHLRCRGFKIYDDHFASIATSFSYQLDQVGLYPWAIYVMSKTQNSTGYHKALVERNLGTWGTVDDESFIRRNALVNSSELLFAARAMREAPDSRAYGGIWYLFKSGDFQKSFDQLQKVLTVDMMNSKDTLNSLLQLMKLFKSDPHIIRNWQNRGSFVWDMLQLLQARSTLSGRAQHLTQDKLHALINSFLKSFVQFKPLNDNESALCIELAVLVQKIVTELMVNHTDVGKTVGLTNVTALFDLSVPKDYKDELRYFVNAWLK